MPVALTIAGSDSGGGAGVQADLRAFAATGVRGTTAITCITAQNPAAIRKIHPLPPPVVGDQIRSVCEAFRVRAVKTGMLYTKGIVCAVSDAVRELRLSNVVVDPVMRATSGARLLRTDALPVCEERLFSLASVITPNVPEAQVLTGAEICSEEDMRHAAKDLAVRFGTACVVKGGHLDRGEDVVDVLYWRGWHVFRGMRIRRRRTHGTGCAFSAALCAWLAKGVSLHNAVARARAYVVQELRRG